MILKRLYDMKEYSAIGLYEEENRSLFYRKALGLRRFYEHCDIPAYQGKPLFPSGKVFNPLSINGIAVNIGSLQKRDNELAEKFRAVAAIEKAHEERYRALLNNVEMQAVFAKAEMTMWECRNCGHLVMGTSAPEVCPVCNHPQSFFEVRKENY